MSDIKEGRFYFVAVVVLTFSFVVWLVVQSPGTAEVRVRTNQMEVIVRHAESQGASETPQAVEVRRARSPAPIEGTAPSWAGSKTDPPAARPNRLKSRAAP